MIYPQNFEQKIGFDQIRSLIKEKCLSTLGIDYTDRMTFSTGYESIREQLNQTWEFVRILENADDFPADFFFDVRPSIKRVRIEGTFLEEAELFDLRRSLDTIQRIIRFLYPGEEEEIKYALGESDSIHDLQIAQQKANISLQYTVAVRNAFLQGYKELMNLQF